MAEFVYIVGLVRQPAPDPTAQTGSEVRGLLAGLAQGQLDLRLGRIQALARPSFWVFCHLPVKARR